MNASPLRLQGAMNFRDFGGLPAHAGRAVVAGRLYRSASLAALNADDFTQLRTLGIRLVCDLRSAEERQHHPTRWPADAAPETLLMDVNADLRAGRVDVVEHLRRDTTEHGAVQLMHQLYREMPKVLLPHLRILLERLVRAPDDAVIVHCTAGKDRTGVFCALLQRALGVPHDIVMSHYLESAPWCASPAFVDAIATTLARSLGASAPDAAVRAIAEVRPAYLEAALEAAACPHGALERYLEQAVPAGMTMQQVHTVLLR